MRILRLEDVEKLVASRRRVAMRLAVMLRALSRVRTSRRSLSDSLRLARLAVEASRSYLEVVSWGRVSEERRLRLRS